MTVHSRGVAYGGIGGGRPAATSERSTVDRLVRIVLILTAVALEAVLVVVFVVATLGIGYETEPGAVGPAPVAPGAQAP